MDRVTETSVLALLRAVVQCGVMTPQSLESLFARERNRWAVLYRQGLGGPPVVAGGPSAPPGLPALVQERTVPSVGRPSKDLSRGNALRKLAESAKLIGEKGCFEGTIPSKGPVSADWIRNFFSVPERFRTWDSAMEALPESDEERAKPSVVLSRLGLTREEQNHCRMLYPVFRVGHDPARQRNTPAKGDIAIPPAVPEKSGGEEEGPSH